MIKEYFSVFSDKSVFSNVENYKSACLRSKSLKAEILLESKIEDIDKLLFDLGHPGHVVSLINIWLAIYGRQNIFIKIMLYLKRRRLIKRKIRAKRHLINGDLWIAKTLTFV